MDWYAAHLISYAEFLDGQQDRYVIYENVVLIEADSFDEAFANAENIGKHYPYDDPNDTEALTVDGRRAKWVFAGVRKIIQCPDTTYTGDDCGKQIVHGTEVTYSQFEVTDKEALRNLVEGDPVTILYES